MNLLWPGMYELFAFCASSIVAPLGATDYGSIPGVFSGGMNLRYDLPGTTAFNALNTGHSAQFVGSYIGVAQYWRRLLSDIGAAPLQALSTGPLAASVAVPMSALTAEQEDSQQSVVAATSRSQGLAAEPQVRAWLPQPLSYQSAATELLAAPYAGGALQGILDTEHPGVLA